MRLYNLLKYVLVASGTGILAFQGCSNKADPSSCQLPHLISYLESGDIEHFKKCAQTEFDLYQSDKNGDNLLVLARKRGHLDLVNWLKKYQYDQWEVKQNKYSRDDMILAIEFDNRKIVEGFIKNGFELNDELYSGMVPSVYAVFNDAHDVLRVLLENGADVNAVFDFRSLVAMAAMFEQKDILLTLIDFGADVNDPDGAYVTPLMFAAKDGNQEIIEILLKNGAKKELKDKNGDVARDWAIRNGHSSVANLLKNEN